MKGLSGYWSELTTCDFARFDPETTVAVFPMGAIEQHGPHLPLCTDTLVAESLARLLVQRLNSANSANSRSDADNKDNNLDSSEESRVRILVLPTLSIGFSPEHSSYAGTLAMPYTTVVDQIMAVCECVAASGIRKILFLNCHGGNPPVMEIAAMQLRQRHGMLVVKSTVLGFPHAELHIESKRDGCYGIHGGTLETSMVMFLRPDLVRMDKLCDFPSQDEQHVAEFTYLSAEARSLARFAWMSEDLNPTGVVGEAYLATAEKGKLAIDHYLGILESIVMDIAKASHVIRSSAELRS
eukprot:ANDGO_06926.mRNA.1 Putative mycofactocin system creatinine amidohydrolase family protein MftE